MIPVHRDVCAILLIANITRCFFWLGEHFEFGENLWRIEYISSESLISTK